MAIVVQKYGGSSVETIENFKIVSKHIIKEYNNHNKVIVVVSAQGNMTDLLEKQALEIYERLGLCEKEYNNREKDVLLSVGEQITIAKLAMYLNSTGYKAKSFMGWQIPIITDNRYQNANIKYIKTKKIKEALKENNIIVIAGFQGLCKEENSITTLGRGGSDQTAVAIAVRLKASKLELYKDVDGIYTSDPHKNLNAQRLEKISYDDMLELSNSGAKVLQNKSIELAKKYNVPILVKSTFLENSIGTLIN